MPQFYDSYYFSPLNLYWDYTKFQYNPKILKKKKNYGISISTSNYCFNIIYSLSLCEHNNTQHNEYKLMLTKKNIKQTNMIYIYIC